MKLSEHIEDLRSHLIKIFIYIITGFIFSAVFYQRLWDIAMYPRMKAAAEMGVDAAAVFPLQLIGPVEGLSVIAGLCLKVSIGIFLPLIFLEGWKFISPALLKKEKKAIRIILLAGTFLFLAGVMAAYFIAVPTGLKFLVSFDKTLSGTVTEWRVDNYFSLLTMACFGFGICFETPLIMLSLTMARIIKPQQILKYWRHSAVIIALLSALFTPPDPFTMVILGGSMLLLFFLGYYLSILSYRKTKRSEHKEKTETYLEEDLGED